METFITNDGRIRIKSNEFQKFWRRGTSNWIFADSTDTTATNLDTLFWPTKVLARAPTVVALCNLGNGNFIKRYTSGSKTSCLNAATKEIDQYSHLHMTELVRSREIYNTTYHLSDARIRDQVVHVVATGTATNTTKSFNIVDLNVSYTDTRLSTWTSSISTKLDVKTTIKTEVPTILGGKIDISSTNMFSGEYKWGETMTTSKTVRITNKITIPPLSTATIQVVVTKGTCDVPFSYKQRDVLISGNVVEYALDDGVYHGTNYYNLSYEINAKPI